MTVMHCSRRWLGDIRPDLAANLPRPCCCSNLAPWKLGQGETELILVVLLTVLASRVADPALRWVAHSEGIA
jgi:hypothetical protein